MEATKEKNEAQKTIKQSTKAVRKVETKASSNSNIDKKNEQKKVTKTSTSGKTSRKNTKTVRKIGTEKAKKEKSLSKKSSTVTRNITKVQSKRSVIPVAEYYDLPYRYNQTIVKILAQTPHSLFIYWDISDDDRANLIKQYGDKFFYETKPVLLVHNQTLNSDYEIEVDDFTNSWYLKTPTSNCVFSIELGRKKITQNPQIDFENNSNILHITSSNILESPNDHILKKLPKTIQFKNVKTDEIQEKTIADYNPQSIYNFIDLYQDDNEFIHNPSSGFNIAQIV